MIINHNMGALNANRQMGVNQANANKSMEKLSSGLKINRAGDDAAGLAISEKMRAQIRGLDQASSNAQDGISLIQTAEGALNETQSILQRMRELSVQSSTDTNTIDDRKKIQLEVDQLAKEITRVSNTTEFNTQNLMAGGFNNKFHIGANENQNVSLSIGAMDSVALGVAGDLYTDIISTSNTGASSISNASKNLDGYKIATSTTTASTNTAAVKNGTGETGTVSGTYTGSRDANFIIKVDEVGSGDKVTKASISKDGGSTYEEIIVDSTTGSDSSIDIEGLKLTITAGASNTKDTTYSFSATAEYKTLQLKDSTGTAVGDAVKIYNDKDSVTIGSAGTGATVDIGFKYNELKDSKEDTISRNTTQSTSAVISPTGGIATEAITYKGIDVSSTQSAANKAITKIDNAIVKVSEERGKIGALQNRLEHTIANLGTSSENLTSAESRIRDVNMAKEMSTFSKNNILSQAAQAMLAQANNQPQQVLQLLR